MINETLVAFPLRDNIFIRRDESDENFSGSLLLKPELYRRKQSAGVVVAVGPEAEILNVRDHVIFRDRTARYIELGDEEIVVVEEGEVLCVLTS